MRQASFADFHKPRLSFGGSLLKATTNPKRARPLSSKLPIHLVLRSTRSWMRSPRHFKAVNDTVHRVARRRGLRVYQYANVGNHLHLLIKISHRGRWAAFIRELTGRVATLAGRGQVWVGRPFTRVVNGWRKAFRSVREYVRLNGWEAEHDLSKADSIAIRELRKIWRVIHPELRLTDWDLE
jgi:REP element-mobilizing transposase RayT